MGQKEFSAGKRRFLAVDLYSEKSSQFVSANFKKTEFWRKPLPVTWSASFATELISLLEFKSGDVQYGGILLAVGLVTQAASYLAWRRSRKAERESTKFIETVGKVNFPHPSDFEGDIRRPLSKSSEKKRELHYKKSSKILSIPSFN